ncbi:hypothetical protein [Yoonia litorea]|uniref:Phytanoyl-CoA dioxygenase (PhyH) n=1 Tax=Yoonia litorea TaxID=1123755 RepID=A0A1I6MDB4_9RHOB|nr:hypothetical protein [Yoonia litorea]SFS13582.1 hypothetical protein SAMN05444714_1573 [Yoonia litorea]
MVERTRQEDGFVVFERADATLRWAQAACEEGLRILSEGGERRHGGTWFVGVDALPNAPDGSIKGIPLNGPFMEAIEAPDHWHRAQLSVVFPGYPRKDSAESDAAHRFRRDRDAAHVDGLLPEGPQKRRHLREPHGFILGLPLNVSTASPLVVWAGSHIIMRDAFTAAFDGKPPSEWADTDVTDVYQAARKSVFETCDRIEIHAEPGQAVLLHRHSLHGVAPWGDAAGDMRMIAYFRPLTGFARWL